MAPPLNRSVNSKRTGNPGTKMIMSHDVGIMFLLSNGVNYALGETQKKIIGLLK